MSAKKYYRSTSAKKPRSMSTKNSPNQQRPKKILTDIDRILPTSSFIIKFDQFWSIKYWLEDQLNFKN